MNRRRWVAGLIELTGNLIIHLGHGAHMLAEHLDPATDEDDDEGDEPGDITTTIDGDHTHHVPTAERDKHILTDDCPCIPKVTGFASTGHGDHWTLTHNPLDPTEET